jgi:hypothetical protein
MFTVSSTGGDEPYSAVRFRESTGDSAARREREKESSIRRTELNKTLWLIIASKLPHMHTLLRWRETGRVMGRG